MPLYDLGEVGGLEEGELFVENVSHVLDGVPELINLGFVGLTPLVTVFYFCPDHDNLPRQLLGHLSAPSYQYIHRLPGTGYLLCASSASNLARKSA